MEGNTNIRCKNVLGMLKNYRTEIAELVYPIWKANKEKVMDRDSALLMLISNATVKKGKEPLYSWGTLTEEQKQKAKDYFAGMTKYEIEREYTAIKKILKKLVWED